MKKLIIYIFLILVCFSCKKEDSSPCFVDTGKNTVIERSLEYFDAIEINNVFNVILVQDSTYKVVIEGKEGLMPYVTTEITDTTLKLDHNISCKWAREYEKITAYIHFDSINDIIINRACNLSTTSPLTGYEIRYWPMADINMSDLELNCKRFFLKSAYTSTGEVNLSGTCHHLQLWAFGSMAIDASELKSTLTYVDHNSIGDFYVNPIYHLSAEVKHLGNVYYNDKSVMSLKITEYSSGRAIPY